MGGRCRLAARLNTRWAGADLVPPPDGGEPGVRVSGGGVREVQQAVSSRRRSPDSLSSSQANFDGNFPFGSGEKGPLPGSAGAGSVPTGRQSLRLIRPARQRRGMVCRLVRPLPERRRDGPDGCARRIGSSDARRSRYLCFPVLPALRSAVRTSRALRIDDAGLSHCASPQRPGEKRWCGQRRCVLYDNVHEADGTPAVCRARPRSFCDMVSNTAHIVQCLKRRVPCSALHKSSARSPTSRLSFLHRRSTGARKGLGQPVSTHTREGPGRCVGQRTVVVTRLPPLATFVRSSS